MKLLSLILFSFLLFSCKTPNRRAQSQDWSKASQASLEERLEILANSLKINKAEIKTSEELLVSWTDAHYFKLHTKTPHTENHFPKTGNLPPGQLEHLDATYDIEYDINPKEGPLSFHSHGMDSDTYHISLQNQPEPGTDPVPVTITATITANYKTREGLQPLSTSTSPEKRKAEALSASRKVTLDLTILPRDKTLYEIASKALDDAEEKIDAFLDNVTKNNVSESFQIPAFDDPKLQLSVEIKAKDEEAFKKLEYNEETRTVIMELGELASELFKDQESIFTHWTLRYQLTYPNYHSKRSAIFHFHSLVKNTAYEAP